MKRLLAVLLIAFLPVFLTACSEDITLPATGTVYGDLVFDDGQPAAGIVVLVEGTGHSAVSDRPRLNRRQTRAESSMGENGLRI